MPLFNMGSLAGNSFGLFKQMQTAVAAGASSDGKVFGQGPFGMKYYLSGAVAGGICCGVTHGALTPVDVVKTRIQLDPVKYNQGFIGGFKQVIGAEGAGALLTGLGPTAQGYFIQVGASVHTDWMHTARISLRARGVSVGALREAAAAQAGSRQQCKRLGKAAGALARSRGPLTAPDSSPQTSGAKRGEGWIADGRS